MIIDNYKETKVHLVAFKCNVCDHIWITDNFSKKNPPNNCSKCKSPKWNAVVPKHLKKKDITKKSILDYLRYYESLYIDTDIGSTKEHAFIQQMIEDVRTGRLEKR